MDSGIMGNRRPETFWSVDLAFTTMGLSVQADKELREMNERMIAEKEVKLRQMKAGESHTRPVAVDLGRFADL